MVNEDKPGTGAGNPKVPEQQQEANVDTLNLPRLSLPVMTQSNIESYFMSLEFWFAASGIGNAHDTKKYNIVMAQVPPSKLTELRSIIEAVPPANKYVYIKMKLIEHFADSQQKRLQLVLSDMPLGDMKPSQLFNEMRRVAGNSFCEPVLLDLWASRLPPHAQAAVIASKGDPTEKATIADAIVESMGLRSINTIGASAPSTPAATAKVTTESPPDRIETLQREIAQLTRMINKMFRSSENPRERSRSRSRSKVSKFRDNEPSYDVCWYHSKYGGEARRCRKPCSFGLATKPSNQQ
ncbi:uncharacterized protein LOC131693765 [Topomyia yanbarensis]|uniref:uncharacterized protein LOC131693765 n=1 Tax=Topomyia yanbarensis TaxID=2498891 RepID=UPI00273BFFDF|nr:uncharacterized protein LOC131693765 [Topomyia yanbarensis]